MSRIVILAKKGLKCKTFSANFLRLFLTSGNNARLYQRYILTSYYLQT